MTHNLARTCILLVVVLATLLAPVAASAVPGSVVTRYHDEAIFDDGYIFTDATITQTALRNGLYTYVVRQHDYWAEYDYLPEGAAFGERRTVSVYRLDANFTADKEIRVMRDVIQIGDSTECVVSSRLVWTGTELVLDDYEVVCS